MQQLTQTPTENPSINIHGNQKNYDINIQCQEFNKGMRIENTLKYNLNNQQKMNASCLVTNNQNDTEDTNSEIRKSHFLVQHGDGEKNEAGSDISLLLLNDKSVRAEGLFLDLDRTGGGVPVAKEIVARRARVGGRGYYGGHSVWNPQG